MAQFKLELPNSIMDDIRKINDNAEEIFGEMTKAGAEVAMHNIIVNAPASIKQSKMMSCLRLTRTYKTPTDKGINTKVGFFGYFENENGQTVPAPLVANVFEYGRSNRPFTKHPFLRKSFRKGDIESAMLKKQSELTGGLLDE